jgi:tyrosine-protein kinase Etk/Wzc
MTQHEIAERHLTGEERSAKTQFAADDDEKGKSHFLDPLVTLTKHRTLVLALPLVIAAITVVLALVIPPTYTAETKIVPPQNASSSSSILNQLGPLASAAANGKDLSMHGPSDMYVAMLHSRTIADALIKRFSLMSVYKAKRHVDARMRLDDDTKITISKENVISISVADHDKNRAAELANAYVDELLKLTRTLAITEAGQRRLFFEHEVQAAGDELANAEQALKKTQETTGIIQLDNQSKAMIESLTTLHAQVGAKEAQVEAMRAYATPENPDLVRAQHELAALRGELTRIEAGQGGTSLSDVAVRKVPEAALEYVRRLREVKYRETLLDLLTRQYEMARIDEAKDAAIVQVLDKAEAPEMRSSPHRTTLVLTAFFLAFSLAILIAFLLESFQRFKADPQFVARVQLLRFYLKGSR